MGVRIDALNATSFPSRNHEIPAMNNGMTAKLSVGQILDLLINGALGGDPDYAHTIGAALSGISDALRTCVRVDAVQSFSTSEKLQALANLGVLDDPWALTPLGSVWTIDDGVTGFAPPPANRNYRYVELTAGLTGAGGYNNGALTSEAVSGSAPLVLATAVISLSGSPFNGQTIRLLNTEGRILRPGTSPGDLQMDAFQNFTGTISSSTASLGGAGAFTDVSISGSRAANSTASGTIVTLNPSLVARTSTETRMKNIAAKAYRRIR